MYFLLKYVNLIHKKVIYALKNVKGGTNMVFYDDIEDGTVSACGCDDHCGSDTWGCDS